jgi:hypothetical protein
VKNDSSKLIRANWMHNSIGHLIDVLEQAGKFPSKERAEFLAALRRTIDECDGGSPDQIKEKGEETVDPEIALALLELKTALENHTELQEEANNLTRTLIASLKESSQAIAGLTEAVIQLGPLEIVED